MFEFKKILYVLSFFILSFSPVLSEEENFNLNEKLKFSSISYKHFKNLNKTRKPLSRSIKEEKLSIKIFSQNEEILFNINSSDYKRDCGNFSSENYWFSCDRNLKNGYISIEIYEKKN